MRQLTLTQPWATLVAVQAKLIETRSWSTDYRGPVAIHAGKGLDPVGGITGLHDLTMTAPFTQVLLRPGSMAYHPRTGYSIAAGLPRGVIVAIANIEDVIPTDELEFGPIEEDGNQLAHVHGFEERVCPEHERAFGDYGPGRFAWLLRDVVALREPVQSRGGLGLRALPAPIVRQIEMHLDQQDHTNGGTR